MVGTSYLATLVDSGGNARWQTTPPPTSPARDCRLVLTYSSRQLLHEKGRLFTGKRNKEGYGDVLREEAVS